MSISIKSRLLVSHILIAVFAVAAASAYLSFSFRNLQIEYYEHALLSEAYTLADALEVDFGNPRGKAQMEHAIGRLVSEEHDRLAVLDINGRVIASTDDSIHSNEKLASVRSLKRGNHIVTINKHAEDDGEHISVIVPIEHSGKTVGAVKTWILESDYQKSLRPIQHVTFLAVLAVVSLSAFISSLLAQALIKPIRRMRQLSRRIARGDLSIRVDDSSSDELGELASDMNSMASRLQDMESVRRDFLGNVSHELRSPVSNIRLTSEVLERRAQRLGDDSAKLFQTIVSETERLDSMISELMEITAIEAGVLSLEQEVVELRPMLENLRQSHLPGAERKNITLGLLADPNIQIVADKAKLERAVRNLLDNAIKFTPEGGQVVVSARKLDGQVVIEVTDNGDGISPEDLPRVFERFYRVDKARQRKGGTGIGLAIAKSIAEAHNGSVEVYSEEGRGSTFRIRLLDR